MSDSTHLFHAGRQSVVWSSVWSRMTAPVVSLQTARLTSAVQVPARNIDLRQEGYVIHGFQPAVILLVRLHKKLQADLAEIFREGLSCPT